MIDITHEQQQSLGYGDAKNGYGKRWVKREGWMYGVTFEGDISVLYYNDKKKSRRMLPFAFQVTDAHAQYNYHHHPSNRRSSSGKYKVKGERTRRQIHKP
jgi:hypothetical protein